MKFGLYLIERGEISAEQLIRAMILQVESRPPLGQLAIEEGLISAREVLSILRIQSDYAEDRFGEIGVEMGLLTRRDVASLLLTQSDRQPPLEQTLVQIGAIDPDRCRDLLVEFREEHEKNARGRGRKNRVRHLSIPLAETAAAAAGGQTPPAASS